MFSWVYDLSTAALTGLLSVVFVLFTWLGAILIRPALRHVMRREQDINDLVGYVLSCYGVFYGLLLGLIAVAAYQNFTDTDRAASEEAAALTALYRDVSSYPEPDRTALQNLLRDYTRGVIEEDWPAQRRGVVIDGTANRIASFSDRLASFEPKTKGQEILHAETMRAFNELSRLRRLRVFTVTSGIPSLMWYIVFIGAGLTVLIVWLFDMSLVARLFLGGMLSFFMALVIALIIGLDRPYRGEVSIEPEAFQNVYDGLMAPSARATSS